MLDDLAESNDGSQSRKIRKREERREMFSLEYCEIRRSRHQRNTLSISVKRDPVPRNEIENENLESSADVCSIKLAKSVCLECRGGEVDLGFELDRAGTTRLANAMRDGAIMKIRDS